MTPYIPTHYKAYAVLQALDVFPFIDFEPEWLIDCGPGLGQEAHRFKERWPKIKVIGMEPVEHTWRLRQKDFPGVLLNAAVWSGDGAEYLHGCDTEMGASLVYSCLTSKSDPVKVSTISLNTLDYWTGPFNNTILWADVEGSELKLIEGSSSLFSRGAIRLMNLEVHEGEEERELDRVCSQLGFEKVFSYAENGAHHDNVYRRKG